LKTLLFIFIILFINSAAAFNTSDSCILCHGYVPKISEIVAPIIPIEEIEEQIIFEPAKLWTYNSECVTSGLEEFVIQEII